MISLFLFTDADCKKQKNCHDAIVISNNSNASVLAAGEWIDSGTKECFLSGSTLKPGESTDLVRGQFSCWEEHLSKGKTFDFYIINSDSVKNSRIYCDSLSLKNKLLKHYVFTLDDMKNSNFAVSYP